jgi:glycosyltransferase involved in cell wall biosynthesis
MPAKSNKLAIYSVPSKAGASDGYSYAGLKIVRALKERGVVTPWKDDSAEISLSFCQPEWYSKAENQYRIAYTPWESTKIPEHWIPMINEMDEFWTTSEFCREVFTKEGVTVPIKVFHHGVDSEEWTVKKRDRTKPFKFFHMGEPAIRKNGQMVVDAFIDKFNGKKDIQLVMKCNEYALARIKEPFGSVLKHPQISLIPEKYSVEQLNSLFHEMNCMVYPSSGEGFGLIPLQAMATGMPTILVDWGGMREFSEFGIKVDYSVGPSNNSWHLGDWAWPDQDDLADAMMEVYEEYEKESQVSFDDAPILSKAFNWGDLVERAFQGILF